MVVGPWLERAVPTAGCDAVRRGLLTGDHESLAALGHSPGSPTRSGGGHGSCWPGDLAGTGTCFGSVAKLQDDPRWRDNVVFNEYFHGDDGAGLGATHQTGWTGLVADLICRPDPFSDDPTGLWSR